MLAAVIGAFLYLRILTKIWLTDLETDDKDQNTITIPKQVSFVLLLATIVTLFLGIWPEPLVEMAQRAVPLLRGG